MTDRLSMIPLSSLRPSKQNVRKTGCSIEIEALAASIESHGLLQNLTVRQVTGTKKKAFEVIAGGRRLAALKWLAKRKRIDGNMEVPCRILDMNDNRDTELSLAENVLRAPIHPADQFEAFSKMQGEGLGPEGIAAHFGISPTVVSQRLKLAAVSPRLITAFRNDEMTLDQLMAFTISDDHKAQERVWFEQPGGHRAAGSIRRALTTALVEADDRRARFVGTEAYEAAGGVIVRDLFRPDDRGYFTDSTLLDRLTSEKLAEEARNIEAEGWQWVEIRTEMDYELLGHFSRLPPEIEELSEEEQKRLDELSSRYDTIVSELGDDAPQDTVAELDSIEAEIEALSTPRERWDDETMVRSGAFVAIDHVGELAVVRGLLKTEAKKASGKKKKRSGKGNGGIPDAVREELSAHRTAALRVELSRHPKIAFQALLYSLVLRTFQNRLCDSCVDIRPVAVNLRSLAVGIAECGAVRAFAERHAEIGKTLPPPEELWEWLGSRELEANLELLAHCVAGTVNALWLRRENAQEERLVQADLLAVAVGLDMTSWWQPTRNRYLDHVTKDGILAAVCEGVSKQASENIAAMKKGAMATRAEELLKDTGWLPKPLRAGEAG